MMLVARLGLSVGKWVSNAGGVVTVLILGVVIVLPYFHFWRGHLPAYHPLPLVLPAMTLFSLSVFSKMTFGALSGFEYVAVFAGESRNPGRNLARSILFTAPIIALLYILGTSGILAFVSPESVDLIGPIPQALSRGFAIFGMAGPIVSIAILLLLMNYLCCYTLYFSANTRLPLVAGWDHLLPPWFTRLHTKYRTPVNSTLFMGGVALAASLAVLIGAGSQESFVLLQIWAWTFYGLAYLAKFAIPLFSAKEKGLRPGRCPANRRRFRISGDVAICRTRGLACNTGRQQGGIFPESIACRRRWKLPGLDDLPGRTAEVVATEAARGRREFLENEFHQNVGTAALGCPPERSSGAFPYRRNTLAASSTRTLDFRRAPVPNV